MANLYAFSIIYGYKSLSLPLRHYPIQHCSELFRKPAENCGFWASLPTSRPQAYFPVRVQSDRLWWDWWARVRTH